MTTNSNETAGPELEGLVTDDARKRGAPAAPPPFATRSIRAFYGSLVRRYKKLFLGMMVLSAVYAGLTAGRLLIFGVLVESVEVHFKYSEEEKVGQPVAAPVAVRDPVAEEAQEMADGGAAAAGDGLASEALDVARDGKLKILEKIDWAFNLVGLPEPRIANRLSKEKSFFMTFFYGTAAVFAVAAIVMAVASFFKQYLGHALVVRMVVDIRNALFTHLSSQSVAYFSQQRSGDIISRLTNDINAIQLSFRFFFQTIVHEPLVVIGCLFVAYAADPVLFWFVMPLYGIVMWPILRSGKKVTRHGRGRLEKLSHVTEGIHQLFTGIRIVKAFGMEHHEREEFADRNQGYIRSSLRMNRAKVKGRALQELFYNIGTAGVVILGAWLLTEKTVTIPSFILFLGAMMNMYAPLKGFSRAWNQIQESSGGVARLLELLRESPETPDRDGAVEFPGVQRKIAFENVTFCYDESTAAEPSGAPVVRELSFEVKQGEMVAIVGPSGAGKTTALDLLARFYDPQAGRITVDGTDICDFKRASYLGGIALVSQDPFLFNATIRENIAYGRPGATQDEVEEAARIAFAHEFILEQPEGYDTVLGERGVKLSGGQRQRLTIARAVVRDAPILILDEATSALDTRAEKEVQRAIENLVRERTTFVIAHRLSTITSANRILVLEEGRLKEFGCHEDLLAKKGTYYHLWRSQGDGGRGGPPRKKGGRRRGGRGSRGSQRQAP
jgi:subfamily B ATP-binding cassette protein MsbA